MAWKCGRRPLMLEKKQIIISFHSFHSRVFSSPSFLPLLQGFSVNFPPDGESTLRCRENRESKQADGDGRDFSALSSSPETNLWNTSHGGAGDCGEGCVPTARAPPLAPSLPCWLITSQAAALGRLRRITCPFREAALDLVRRLAGVRAPLGRCC